MKRQPRETHAPFKHTQIRDLTTADCTGTKMLRKITSFCVAVLLTLSSVDAAQRKLNTLHELKECHLYKQTNILELLRWFADTVNFENTFIQLTFDPQSDYGSHHYRNDERILDPLPAGYRYYTVGNINRDTSKRLPPNVVHAQRGNKARIVFRVRENGRTIDQVYITQHYDLFGGHGSTYDRDHTYWVNRNLLRAQRSQTAYDMEPSDDGSMSDDSVAAVHFGNESNTQRYSSSNRDGYMRLSTTNYSNEDDCNCCRIFGCVIFVVICIALGINFGFARK